MNADASKAAPPAIELVGWLARAKDEIAYARRAVGNELTLVINATDIPYRNTGCFEGSKAG